MIPFRRVRPIRRLRILFAVIMLLIALAMFYKAVVKTGVINAIRDDTSQPSDQSP